MSKACPDERSNRADFKADVIAALGKSGLRFDPRARRSRDARVESKHGKGAVMRRWLTGIRVKPETVGD